MDLNFTAKDLAFRKEVIDFLKEELPKDVATLVKRTLL